MGKLLPMDPTAVLVALGSLVLGMLSPREMYGAINGPVLLTVAASFGVGAAVHTSGLASRLAMGVLSIASSGGPTVVLASVVILALALGIIVSNNTTVILLAPLVKKI